MSQRVISLPAFYTSPMADDIYRPINWWLRVVVSDDKDDNDYDIVVVDEDDDDDGTTTTMMMINDDDDDDDDIDEKHYINPTTPSTNISDWVKDLFYISSTAFITPDAGARTDYPISRSMRYTGEKGLT